MPHCPGCDKPISLELPTAPFCSDRCRLIDLGRWLDEAQGLPVRRPGPADEDSDDDTPTASSEHDLADD